MKIAVSSIVFEIDKFTTNVKLGGLVVVMGPTLGSELPSVIEFKVQSLYHKPK